MDRTGFEPATSRSYSDIFPIPTTGPLTVDSALFLLEVLIIRSFQAFVKDNAHFLNFI